MPPNTILSTLRCPQWHLKPFLPICLTTKTPSTLPPLFLIPYLSQPGQPTPILNCARLLTTSSRLNGGKTKSNHQRAAAKLASTDADPVDFSDYTTDISSIHSRLRIDLGNISVSALGIAKIEALKVRLKNTASSSEGGATGAGAAGQRRGEGKKVGGAQEGGGVVGLAEIASVYRRGKDIVVVASEKEYLKALLSSLTTLSNTTSPVQSPNSPLEIHLPIPPTTSESRAKAAKEAQERGQVTLGELNAARGEQKKKLKALWLEKQIGSEELKKLEADMEKKNRAAGEEVKRIVEEGKRRLERV